MCNFIKQCTGLIKPTMLLEQGDRKVMECYNDNFIFNKTLQL
jgi:hypothetical protein